jgi:peptidoglycan hydrolase-like protein with peptidoglycan-binding domain
MPATSGIPSVDALYSGAAAPPIGPDADPAAIGAIQDLLSGHGFTGLPNLAASAYGVFGPKTTAALRSFQAAHGLPPRDLVDAPVLSKLIREPAADARASRVYVSLALELGYSSMLKTVCLVAQMEGMGRFGALNRNTDRAGLSFGIIQWAQRPGRLAEILGAFCVADTELFARHFGDGDAALAQALLRHVRQPGGGVSPDGRTTNPSFDLVEEPWVSRFRAAAHERAFQPVQFQTAMAAFERSLNSIRRATPEAVTERSVAFLLDLANQFGDAGAARLCQQCRRAGMSESDLLSAVADRSVAAMPANFQPGVRNRRDLFLHTTALSDARFQ